MNLQRSTHTNDVIHGTRQPPASFTAAATSRTDTPMCSPCILSNPLVPFYEKIQTFQVAPSSLFSS